MNKNRVEKVVFGGKGLVRHDALVVFIDDVLPNEEISFFITEKRKSFALATLDTVHTPNAQRVESVCPYFGICGGCQLQHAEYSLQLELKKGWLKESLERIAGMHVAVPIVAFPAKNKYGYRQKIVLHAFSSGVGYIDRSGKELCISCCPIFLEGKTHLFSHLKQAEIPEGSTITVFKEPSFGICLHISLAKTQKNSTEKIYEILSQHGYRVFVENAKQTIGAPIVFEGAINGITYFFSPKVFIQNDPEHFAHIYSTVLEAITSSGYEGAVLDLYSGVGILSLMLAAKGFDVSAVELNAQAVIHAKEAAKKNEIDRAQFFCGRAEDVRRYVNVEKHQVWIINPPRTGLCGKMREEIARSAPEYLFYISCEPTTLARDLKYFNALYTIESLSLYDMFSQTTHFETVVCLRKKQLS